MSRWMNYPLQEEEPEPEGGGGGDPPKDPPADPLPEGDKEGTISLEALPADLRDRPAAEVKFLLEHMIASLGDKNTEVSGLREELAEMRGVISTAPPPEPDPLDDTPMEELILSHPEVALDRWATKKGYISGMTALSERVGEAEFGMVAAKVEDFAEHEADVRKLLGEGNLPATKTNIMGAYTMVLGTKVLAETARAGRVNTGIPPSNAPVTPDPSSETPVLSALETEVMRAHGMEDPAEWIKYRDEPPELKLPT